MNLNRNKPLGGQASQSNTKTKKSSPNLKFWSVSNILALNSPLLALLPLILLFRLHDERTYEPVSKIEICAIYSDSQANMICLDKVLEQHPVISHKAYKKLCLAFIDEDRRTQCVDRMAAEKGLM